jgi:hypothetical protein
LQWTLLYGDSLIHATRESARTASLSHRVIERVSQGDVSPGMLEESLAAFARSRGADYAATVGGLHERFLGRLVQLSLERARHPSPSELPPAQEFVEQITRLYFGLLNDLTDVRSKYQEDYLREALAVGTPAGGDCITLVAEVGAIASASLSLAGPASAPATVRCIATDVRRADGVGPAFAPAVVITPDVLDVEPDGEAAVTISLRLDESRYQPDALYVGKLQILRGGGPRVDVPMRIRATRPAR